MNQEIISKLHEELEYTKLKSNIEKLYAFLTSEKSKDVKPYHRALLEVQLNAMNIYYNTLVLRISGLQIDDQQAEKESAEQIEPSKDDSTDSK
jgi:hypothetical protein